MALVAAAAVGMAAALVKVEVADVHRMGLLVLQ
jgi:hypothetical protein